MFSVGIVSKCDAFCQNLSFFVILFITLKNRCILYKKTNTVTRKKIAFWVVLYSQVMP